MNAEDLINIVKDIIAQANLLKQHITDKPAPVNYACIFCQNEHEYSSFLEITHQLGNIAQDTKTGPIFHIKPISSVAGELKLLKIRMPDPTRSERGDADFTLSNYKEFKKEHLNQNGFRLIDKGNFEMIEYKAPNAKVLVYFSNPTLSEVLGVA